MSRRRITITAGEFNNSDSLVGYRRGRQRFGEMLVKYRVHPSWGKAKFTLIASRPTETRPAKDDDFDLLIQLDRDINIEAVKKTTLRIYRIGNCRTGRPEKAITPKISLADKLDGPRGIKFVDDFNGPVFKRPGHKLYFDFVYDANAKEEKEKEKEKEEVVPKFTLSETSILRKIEKAELIFTPHELIMAKNRSEAKHLKLKLLDSKYFTVPLELWKAIIARNTIDKHKYVSDKFDCDDFAFAFKSAISRRYGLNTVGIVVDYSGKHSYNCIFVRHEKRLVLEFLEPQTDRLIVEGDMYAMKKGFILL